MARGSDPLMLAGALRPLMAALWRRSLGRHRKQRRLVKLVSDAGRRRAVQRRRTRLPR
jgi:hypothetical protein